jgi:hypothetical protein
MSKWTFLMLVMLFPFIGKAQTYKAFPDSNAKWTVSSVVGFVSSTISIYQVKNDSVYNSFTYKKYFRVSDTSINPVSSQLFAIVRQDIPAKKVYAIQSGTNSEKLIYDFSLNTGDSVSVYTFENFFSGSHKLKVCSKDSLLVNGAYRKRIALISYSGSCPGYPFTEYWIEGIGSSYGIFNSGIGDVYVTDVCYPELLCHKKNGTLEYINPAYNSCFHTCTGTGLKSPDLQHSLPDVSPNPATEFLKINNDAELCEISDVSGRVLRSECPDNGVIKLTGLEKGVYLIRLLKNNKLISTHRFVKE